MKAYFFSSVSNNLGYGDLRPILIGITHTTTGEVVATKNGLHASRSILTSLKNSSGRILYLVESSGEFDHKSSFFASTSRKYLEALPFREIVTEFVNKKAIEVLHLIDGFLEKDLMDILKSYLFEGKCIRKGIELRSKLSLILDSSKECGNLRRYYAIKTVFIAINYWSVYYYSYFVFSIIYHKHALSGKVYKGSESSMDILAIRDSLDTESFKEEYLELESFLDLAVFDRTGWCI